MSIPRVHTYWYLNSLALKPNDRHFLINFLLRKLEMKYVYIYIYIAGCSLGSNLKNVIVGLDVDLALFRGQATAGTSDDIDHRRIYASRELNFYIAPLYHSRKISLCICIYSIQCNSYLWSYIYIYISVLSLSLEIPLCSYHSSYVHHFYRCVLCISILPLFMLRIYSFMY